jgi:hypothetical protein
MSSFTLKRHTRGMRHLKVLTIVSILLMAGLQLSLVEAKSSPKVFAVGELLTVRTRDVPENTKMVTYSLDRQVRGLLMQPSGRHQWSGNFLIAPAQAGTTLRPVLTYHLRNGSTFDQTLEPIEVSAARNQQPGVLSSTENGRLVCLFNKVVSGTSVRVVTTDGQSLRVGHENNYFVLPPKVSSDNLRAVTARTIHGETLTLTPRSEFAALK